jgi:DNA polymerase-3 subunit beta
MTCHREGLLTAFQLVSAALPAKEVQPILRNIKAIVEEDRCTLMATDLDLGIRLEVRGLEVEEPGEAILPAAKFTAILRESLDEKLDVEADNNACWVRNDQGSEWEMTSEDPANFPDLPSFAEEKYHQLSAGDLRTMIRRTAFAAATEPGRYTMNGVLWEAEGDRVRLVATDGKRLALTEGPAVVHGGHSTKGQTPVVPTKAMNLLERNLQDDDEQVYVSLRPNEVLFRTEGERGRAVIYSRLVEGRYPPYRDIFPKKQTVKIPLQPAAFQAAVRQAAIMTDEDSKKVVFHFTKKKLTLEARRPGSGRSKVELPLDAFPDGKNIDINFNPAYVVEMLRILDEDAELILELVDGNNPAQFKAGDNYSYLVMPLA